MLMSHLQESIQFADVETQVEACFPFENSFCELQADKKSMKMFLMYFLIRVSVKMLKARMLKCETDYSIYRMGFAKMNC